MSMFLSLFLTAIVIIAITIISLYNSFVKKDNLAQEAWHGIDVQLKRRYDLIPNLIETVKGYAKHEKSTLEEIISLRNMYKEAGSVDEKAKNSTELSHMLKSVFALSEAYPDLKANQNFVELQNSLEKIEEDIQSARRYYNATVREFNTLVMVFPANLIAAKFGFVKKEFFQVEDEKERSSVKVSF